MLYADDESFTLMTPQGHIFAGWIDPPNPPKATLEDATTLVDRRRQWRYARNVWLDAGIRSGLYGITHPRWRPRVWA